jgi:IS30 family transposase
MTNISERAAEAARSEPGHWEGDLITGASNKSAIGTLVDRATRYTILLHLPGRHTAEAVRDALIAVMSSLPPELRRSLTWDQGKELALHKEVSAALGMPVCFCDKASPWQRPGNENTNGLLRQYFPKGSDLRVHGTDDLDAVAAELNAGPARRWAGTRPRPGSATDRAGHRAAARRSCDNGFRARHATPYPRAARRTATGPVQARHGQ